MPTENEHLQPMRRMSVNAEFIEKLMIFMNAAPLLDFKKKFRVVLEHDPKKSYVMFTYFSEDESESENRDVT